MFITSAKYIFEIIQDLISKFVTLFRFLKNTVLQCACIVNTHIKFRNFHNPLCSSPVHVNFYIANKDNHHDDHKTGCRLMHIYIARSNFAMEFFLLSLHCLKLSMIFISSVWFTLIKRVYMYVWQKNHRHAQN